MVVEFFALSIGKRPKNGRLVGARREEREVARMPSRLDHLVAMFGDHFRRQRLREVALQVGEHDAIVVSAREQVVRLRRKSYRTYVARVRSERLYYAAATHVVQHTLRVLVARDEQPAGRIHRHGSRRASCARQRISFTLTV